MQPEAPAALARTGLVVVACWVLNAPVLLAIRVLWARVGLAVVPPAPLVTAALLSAARASDCRMPPARRRRRQSHSEHVIFAGSRFDGLSVVRVTAAVSRSCAVL